MVRLTLLTTIALAAICHASLTAGWKIPIEHIAPDYKTSDQVKQLNNQPGESAFFQPGDELWDVSKLLVLRPSPDPIRPDEAAKATDLAFMGKWAVWNSRSGMLVARGTYLDLLHAQDACVSVQLLHASLHFELKRGERIPEHLLTVVVPDGETIVAETKNVRIEAEPWLHLDCLHDLHLDVTWNAEEQGLKWRVTTLLPFKDGVPLRIASHGEGADGWTLFGTVAAELPDGSPAVEARWIETDREGFRVWPDTESRQGNFLLSLDGERSIRSYPVPPAFRDGPAPKIPQDLPAPPALKDLIGGNYADVTKVLGEAGIDIHAPGFFAGFDQEHRELLVVANLETHKAIKALVEEALATPERTVWVGTNQAGSLWGLALRNGEKALISLEKDETEIADFIIEAKLQQSGAEVRLHTTIDVIKDWKRRARFEVPLLMPVGKDQPFASLADEDGEMEEITIRAEVISH